jgi:hypothetical protein
MAEKIKAKESHEIEKLREKLAVRLNKQSNKSSPEALESMRRAIKNQFEQKVSRSGLKKRSVKIYDKSKGPEIHSKFIKKLMLQLKNQ